MPLKATLRLHQLLITPWDSPRIYLRAQLLRFSAQECWEHQCCGLMAWRAPMCLRMAKGPWGPLPSIVALSTVAWSPPSALVLAKATVEWGEPLSF